MNNNNLNNTQTNVFEDINKKIDQNIEQLEKVTNDNDIISKVSNVKVGTDEYNEVNKYLENVKNINSTNRINHTIRILKVIGYTGLILTGITELMGSVYDLNYHVPELKGSIGVFGIGILGFLITLISVLLAHKMGDGLVNNKWKNTPRFILIFFMLIGVILGLYFNYRMVTNYTSNLIIDLKNKQLSNNTDVAGVKSKQTDIKLNNLNNKLNNLNNKLKTLNERIIDINKQKDIFTDNINKAIEDKRNIKSRREINKINQNIYTSRKQIKILDEEINKVNEEINKVNEEINKVNEEINKLSNNKINIIKNVDEELESEKFNRLLFLFILVLFFKISSFMGLLADFIANKNTEAEYMEKLNSINNIVDANSVISANLMRIEAQQISNMNKNLGMMRLNNETSYLSSLNNMHQQTNATRGFISATNELTNTNTELVNLAIDGAKNAIIAGIENKKRRALEEILENKLLDKGF